jgi:hypothetical protein
VLKIPAFILEASHVKCINLLEEHATPASIKAQITETLSIFEV